MHPAPPHSSGNSLPQRQAQYTEQLTAPLLPCVILTELGSNSLLTNRKVVNYQCKCLHGLPKLEVASASTSSVGFTGAAAAFDNRYANTSNTCRPAFIIELELVTKVIIM